LIFGKIRKTENIPGRVLSEVRGGAKTATKTYE